MRYRTSFRMLTAAACAGLATYLTVSFLMPRPDPPGPSVAAPDVRPAPSRDTRPDTRTVVVAAVPLRFGAALTAEMLTEVQWPAASVPAGAFSGRSALLGPGGQRTVLTSIGKGEPILASKVTGPGQRGSLSMAIEEGMKAVTIRVDDVLGVAGLVQPGDYVDVLMTRNDRVPAPGGKAVTGVAYSDVLLQHVRVLAIDQVTDRGPKAKPAKAVTIEVTAEGAQKVALGQQVGQLSLALLRSGSPSGTDVRRINIEDLSGPRPGVRTPPTERRNDDSTVVTVTRGTDRRSYEITDTGRREIKLSDKRPVAVQAPVAAQLEQ